MVSRKARRCWLHDTRGIDEAGICRTVSIDFGTTRRKENSQGQGTTEPTKEEQATPSTLKTWIGSAGTSLAKTMKSAASAKAGSRTVRSRGEGRLAAIPEEEQTRTTPIAHVEKKTKRERWKCPICGWMAPLTSMRQLECNHFRDWHPTQTRMLKLSVRQDLRPKVGDEVPLWQWSVCQEGFFIDPRSRVGRKARELPWSQQAPGYPS